MTQQEIITRDHAHLVNAKTHLEAFTFSDESTECEHARRKAIAAIAQAVVWLDYVKMGLNCHKKDRHPIIGGVECQQSVPQMRA